jgi:hypothetical protein
MLSRDVVAAYMAQKLKSCHQADDRRVSAPEADKDLTLYVVIVLWKRTSSEAKLHFYR